MRKLLTLAVLAATAAVAATPALAESQAAPAKAWVCHKTGSTFTTTAGTFVKFVAIRVSGRAVVQSHLRHGDVLVSPAPTGSLKAQRDAARRACAALRVAAPISPTQGGVESGATLTGGGVTANLNVRAQVGQRRLCFTLQVTGPAGSTVQLSSLTLVRGSTTVTIPASQLTGTSPSGCITLDSRDVAKQLLQGNVTATLEGTTTPSGGTATPFRATGTLSR